MTLPAEEDPNNDTDSALASQPQFQNLVKGKDSDFSTLDVTNIVNSGLPEVIQYSSSPISKLPSYENNITTENIAYMPIHLLDNNSPISIAKEYSRTANGVLTDGEQIKVTVTLTARQSTQFTYLDQIQGPRQIEKNDDGSISSRNR